MQPIDGHHIPHLPDTLRAGLFHFQYFICLTKAAAKGQRGENAPI